MNLNSIYTPTYDTFIAVAFKCNCAVNAPVLVIGSHCPAAPEMAFLSKLAQSLMLTTASIRACGPSVTLDCIKWSVTHNAGSTFNMTFTPAVGKITFHSAILSNQSASRHIERLVAMCTHLVSAISACVGLHTFLALIPWNSCHNMIISQMCMDAGYFAIAEKRIKAAQAQLRMPL